MSRRAHHRIQTVAFLVAAIAVLFVFGESSRAATVSTFTGLDPGEGLDLQGTFTYAVDVGVTSASSVTIYDATFVNESPAGFTIGNTGGGTDLATPPTYGASTAENDLETLMRTVTYGDTVTVALANLTVGQPYQLQLLFHETNPGANFNDQRLQNVTIEGNALGTLDLFDYGSLSGNGTGVVVTELFTPTLGNTTLDISFVKDAGSNYFAAFNGLTLEALPVPEPASASILSLVALIIGKRRRG
jgi:hypothetical protein